MSGDEFNKAKKLRTTKNDSEINETLKKDKTNSESSGSKESLEITRRPRVELMISNNLIFQNRAGDLSDEERSEKRYLDDYWLRLYIENHLRRKKIKYNSSYDKKPARTTNKEESNKVNPEGPFAANSFFLVFRETTKFLSKGQSIHANILLVLANVMIVTASINDDV